MRPVRRLGANPKCLPITANISDWSTLMSSILNNPAALERAAGLADDAAVAYTVQNQVSTGLKVATAADNSSYWSIAAQLTADSGVVKASNDALSQGQSLLATASSAINSVITTINSIQTALTQATEPGADIANINTSLASLGKQLTDAVNARFVQWHERSQRQRRVPQLRRPASTPARPAGPSTPSPSPPRRCMVWRPAERRPRRLASRPSRTRPR